ncbi:fatty acid desaturase family protein [Rhodopseudomonas palustris]|uniref:Fatty acid desaturase n=1 Tax=Rhodopseudomonas palustris (strain BisB5) TaxID=316057 RepID=Q13A19_RHOPS|nr:fatty acid desaturase [Rhodopseudomonas palustris BisB5]MBB1090610.1 fatty acid desaturase family protein [Rhodopseudomonas palustris]
MPAVARIDPKTIFSAEEWARLTRRSSARGVWLVAHAWGTIAAAMALVTIWPNPLTWLIAVMIVGTRQLGLAILMHEAAHGGLHRNQKLNEWIGQWLCAVPVGADLAAYRSYHLQHHKYTQQPEDPDLSLSAPFPISKQSFLRKAIRDLTGQTFVKQRLPLLKALFATRHAREDVTHESFVASGADRTKRFLAANLALFVVFWLCGAGVWFVGVWLFAMATWLPLVTRVRNIAEHACTSTSPDPFSQARTTLANPLERLLIAPYWVNYHAEHHLFMYLPCYNLPEAHRLLRDKALIGRVAVAPSYRDVLRLAMSRERSTRAA